MPSGNLASRFGTGIETDTIRYSAAHATFLYKIGMANLWFFGWLVELIMAADPTTDAAQRTTTSPTILSAGVKTNIVPMEAYANINHRIHPSDTLDDVLKHDREAWLPDGDSQISRSFVFGPSGF